MTAEIPIELTLANIAGGALSEQATLEIRKLCANILDVNTDAEAKRKLQITIVFKPNDKRNLVDISYEVKSTLIGPEAGSAVAFVAVDPEREGEASLYELPTHKPLFPPAEQQTIPGVIEPLEKRA